MMSHCVQAAHLIMFMYMFTTFVCAPIPFDGTLIRKKKTNLNKKDREREREINIY